MEEDFALLVLANDQPFQVPGKTYDYLATGRRIMAVTEPDSATADLLRPLEGCAIVESCIDVVDALKRFCDAFRAGASIRVDRAAFMAEASYPRRTANYARLLQSMRSREP
jgi:hypothetical protein